MPVRRRTYVELVVQQKLETTAKSKQINKKAVRTQQVIIPPTYDVVYPDHAIVFCKKVLCLATYVVLPGLSERSGPFYCPIKHK